MQVVSRLVEGCVYVSFRKRPPPLYSRKLSLEDEEKRWTEMLVNICQTARENNATEDNNMDIHCR
jgi:hypothetical protein